MSYKMRHGKATETRWGEVGGCGMRGWVLGSTITNMTEWGTDNTNHDQIEKKELFHPKPGVAKSKAHWNHAPAFVRGPASS